MHASKCRLPCLGDRGADRLGALAPVDLARTDGGDARDLDATLGEPSDSRDLFWPERTVGEEQDSLRDLRRAHGSGRGFERCTDVPRRGARCARAYQGVGLGRAVTRPRFLRHLALTENRSVGGSIPPLGTILPLSGCSEEKTQ